MPEQRERRQNDALTSGLPNIAVTLLPLPPTAEHVYRGVRHADGSCGVLVEQIASGFSAGESHESSRPLPLHLEARKHSPTGFAWGYGGSGPAQLALALLIDATGDQNLDLEHYQDFKWQFVAGWGASWSITAKEIREFLAAQNKQAHADVLAKN